MLRHHQALASLNSHQACQAVWTLKTCLKSEKIKTNNKQTWNQLQGRSYNKNKQSDFKCASHMQVAHALHALSYVSGMHSTTQAPSVAQQCPAISTATPFSANHRQIVPNLLLEFEF